MKTRRWLGLLVLLGILLAMASCEGSQSPQEPPFIGTVLDANRVDIFYLPDAKDTGPTGTIVPFNVEVVDEFDAYDTSTGVYTVAEAGDYDVSYGIRVDGTIQEFDPINFHVNTSSGSNTTTLTDYEDAPAGMAGFYHTGSKSLTGLSVGDEVTFSIYQDNDAGSTGGIQISIADNQDNETYLTIEKVK